MAKHRPPQDPAEELRKLKKKMARQRREMDEAQKKLILCIKECLKKLEHPPWHYGPHCK
jgi:hypothetical protein